MTAKLKNLLDGDAFSRTRAPLRRSLAPLLTLTGTCRMTLQNLSGVSGWLCQLVDYMDVSNQGTNFAGVAGAVCCKWVSGLRACPLQCGFN
ncbi:hypothetical protein [Zoogloea sp.]|uniref:hypothetical protein n=1 Tax=Zoogloea sp. TaxID=49181 RepID=UPI001D342835|nr:hypothetical protein [Zoogloea sp.]MBK6656017.1 hypothetical protein [Zoogloea sp.]